MQRRAKRKFVKGADPPSRSNFTPRLNYKGPRPRPAFHGFWASAAVCILLSVGVWIVFGQTLRFDFVNYDDNTYVYNNPHIIHGLNLRSVLWALTHAHSGNWHPLATLTHMFDCQLYGLHPWGHHLGNVLLHQFSAMLLFLLLQKMSGAFWRSAFVAAVFAIHPLHVESVAWISERKDVLSGVFFMLTLLAYCYYARIQDSERSRTRFFLHSRSYWLALLLYVLGLMSKPVLVSLPFVLLLLDWWPLRRITIHNPRFRIRQLLWEKSPFLLLSAACCALTISSHEGAMMSLQKLNFSSRVGNALVSYVAYIGQTIYPMRLAVLYPHPANHLLAWRISVSVLFLLLVSVGVAAGYRKHPFLLTGWFWYLGMLVPVIGLVQVGGQARADRYTYLPQIGLLIMVAWGGADLCGSWRYRRAVLGTGVTVILAVLLVVAYIQTTYWKDSISLMTHAIACNSDVSLAHNNLGNALATEGKTAEAIEHYERAIQLQPDHAEAHNNLANALMAQGNTIEAVKHYEQAIQLNPGSPEMHNNIGNALATEGRIIEAIEHYRKAIQLNPDYADAHYNLGKALAVEGQRTEAIEHYREAIRLNPDYADAHNNLANALAAEGKINEAIQHYKQALRLNPDYAEAHYNLANALAEEGDLPQAVQHLEKAFDLASAQKNIPLAETARGRLKTYQGRAAEIPADAP
jgi:protein O-mannosyl-transferase